MHVPSNISALNRHGHRISKLRGMGDWFSPDCTPGSQGCVPHWYCYIPGAVTPDCLASLGQGISETTQAVVAAAGGVAGAAAGGVVSGTCLAALGTSNLAQTICKSPGTYALVGAGVLVALVWALKS